MKLECFVAASAGTPPVSDFGPSLPSQGCAEACALVLVLQGLAMAYSETPLCSQTLLFFVNAYRILASVEPVAMLSVAEMLPEMVGAGPGAARVLFRRAFGGRRICPGRRRPKFARFGPHLAQHRSICELYRGGGRPSSDA